MFARPVKHLRCNTLVFMIKTEEGQVLYCPHPDCRHDVDPEETFLEPLYPDAPKPEPRLGW